MRKWFFRLTFILMTFPTVLSAADELRQNTNINRDWQFKLGDQSIAQASTPDETGWDAINLPHSFSIPYFQSKDFYVGYGWYRKHLDIKPQWLSQRVSLEFEAAFQDAQIYVNGQLMGQHKGGFTGFSPRRSARGIIC
jgi:beta-galactosidase/beta-glucuronidase